MSDTWSEAEQIIDNYANLIAETWVEGISGGQADNRVEFERKRLIAALAAVFEERSAEYDRASINGLRLTYEENDAIFRLGSARDARRVAVDDLRKGQVEVSSNNGHSHDEVIDINYIGIFIIPCHKGHFHVQINALNGSVLQKSFDSIQEVLDNLSNLNGTYDDRLVRLLVGEE